jgi:hypothetical protein
MANGDSATEVLEERPLRELLLKLSQDAGRLFEQEIALAKQEAREKLEQLQAGMLAVSAGALVLQVGFLALTAALILLLAQALPGWAAAAVIGGAFCVVGGLMLAKGKRELQHVDIKPEKTVSSVKQDAIAIKEAAE